MKRTRRVACFIRREIQKYVSIIKNDEHKSYSHLYLGSCQNINVLRDGILTHHSSYQLIISSSIDILSWIINTFIVIQLKDAKFYKLEYYCTHKNPHTGIRLRMTGHTQPYIIILVPYNQSYRDIAIDNGAWRSPHHMCTLCPNQEIEDQDHLTW